MEVVLGQKRLVFLRKSEGATALCRLYLVSLDQAFDIARFKNYRIDISKRQEANLPIESKTMDQL
jgi:hypothetical protein